MKQFKQQYQKSGKSPKKESSKFQKEIVHLAEQRQFNKNVEIKKRKQEINDEIWMHVDAYIRNNNEILQELEP